VIRGSACSLLFHGPVQHPGPNRTPPDSAHTDATVTLRPVDGVPTITKVALVTVGKVPGLEDGAFVEHAREAEAGCPVSRGLAGVPEITLEASLVW
jgi:lipoyl-dependent peroxiredoxin